jgi:hypothetical protein
MDLSALKQTIAQGAVEVTQHAYEALLADGVTAQQTIWASLLTSAELVEDYPNASRGACCLLLSFLPDGRPLHSVVAFPAPRVARRLTAPAAVVLITVYRPDLRPREWSADYRTRLAPGAP